MPSTSGFGLTGRRSRQRQSGALGVLSPVPQENGTSTISSVIRHYGKDFLLRMPFEIIVAILVEWSMLEWFAPASARRICRTLKEITDDSPRVWSKLFIPNYSPATAANVREWLERARALPKEVLLATENIFIVSAALRGAEDATSLIYRIPTFKHIRLRKEQISLPVRMARLRHLHLDTSNIYDFMCLSNVISPDTHFPCLTTLHLTFVDLVHFRIKQGLFPAMRRLVLHAVCGPILDLIRICSGSLEDLRVIINFSYDRQSLPDGRICLPNLKVLVVDQAVGIVSKLEAPILRLICADLDEIDGSTRPFSSVVEWATRQCPSLCLQMDITNHLINMPRLQHLMIFRHAETLRLCFEYLRDNSRICPDLQSIEVAEVAEFANTRPEFKLDINFKEFLKECIEGRADKVPGFTLQFVDNEVQESRLRLRQHYATDVCLLTVMRHHSSYYATRRTLARLKTQWRPLEQTHLSLCGTKIGTVGIITATNHETLRLTASVPSQAGIFSGISVPIISLFDLLCTFFDSGVNTGVITLTH